MPIGGTEMANVDDEPSTTKDIDVVIVTLLNEGAATPAYDGLVAFAQALSGAVETRKDHTSVKVRDASALRRGNSPPTRVHQY